MILKNKNKHPWIQLILGVLAYRIFVLAISKKGNNLFDFRYVSLGDEAHSIRVYALRKEFAPVGANSFLEELTPIKKGGKK